MAITILPNPLPDPLAVGLRQLGTGLAQRVTPQIAESIFGPSQAQMDVRDLNDWMRFQAGDIEQREQLNASRRHRGMSELNMTAPSMRSPQGNLMLLNQLQRTMMTPAQQAQIQADQARTELIRRQTEQLDRVSPREQAEIELIKARAGEIKDVGPLNDARAKEVHQRIRTMEEDIEASKAARQRYAEEAKRLRKKDKMLAREREYVSLQKKMEAWVDILETTIGKGVTGADEVIDPTTRQKALVAIAGLASKMDRLDTGRGRKRKGSQQSDADPLGLGL